VNSIEAKLKKMAMGRGPREEKVGLYEREMVEGKPVVSDISLDGRFYIVFRSASASQRATLETAQATRRMIPDEEGGKQRMLLEVDQHGWDLIEAAVLQGLIVEACLPAIGDDADLADFKIDRADKAEKVVEELNQAISPALETILVVMITDKYLSEDGVPETIVGEAGNSLSVCSPPADSPPTT